MTETSSRVSTLNEQVRQFTQSKEELKANQAQDSKSMEKEYEERNYENTKEKAKLFRAQEKVTAVKKMQSSLHQRIVDLEKVIGDFETEQRRIQTKNETVLTQTIEMEAELREKGMLTEDQIKRF